MKTGLKTFNSLWLYKCFLLPQLFIFLVTAFNVKAQHHNLTSRYLTVKDGLPQGYISGIVQDKAGFIWISTRNGLARYDGKKFKVFYHDSNDTTTIAGNIIRNIFLDSKNRLWIKYENAGFDIFYPETGKINHISKQAGLDVLNNIDIEADGIFEDADNGILINSPHFGFIKLTVNTPARLQYPLQKVISKDEEIVGVNQNNTGGLFVLTTKYLYHLNKKQELVSKASLVVPSAIEKSVQGRYGIFFQDDASVLIAGINRILRYQLKNDQYIITSALPAVNKMRGGKNYCLMYPNNSQGVLAVYNARVSDTFPANANTNISSLLDKSNVLWIGTNGYGIQLVHLRSYSFQYYKYTPPFSAFILQKYFGVPLSKTPPGLTSVESIYGFRWAYDKTGKLWMSNIYSHDRKNLQVFAYDSRGFTTIAWHYPNGNRVKNYRIIGTATDSKNNVWVLTADSILKLNTQTGVVQSLSRRLPGHIESEEESLYIDKQDNLWIASNIGLLLFREGWQNFIHYSISKNIFDSESNRVINIAEDLHDENKLWMGSLGNGLICFDKKEKKFTLFTTKDGLPDNTIYSVMADNNGYLWCSTNKGIFRFDTRLKKARKYADENGAPDFEFNRFHHVRLPDGRFAFAGFDDYTVFDPMLLTDDTSHPGVAITNWKINNQPAEYRDAGSPLQQSINSLAEVRLTYLQNFITFEFAALQYDQPEIYEYRYKLSGIDKDWVYTGTNTSVNYTALPPGTYSLSINAANASGLWSDKVKQLRIIIEPPWYKTWWFYTAMIIAALSIIYAVYRYRLNQLLKLNKVRDRIARDLHDEVGSSLSTISIYAKVMQQQLTTGGNVQPLLTKISDNANQVQDAMNDIVWSINAKNDELENIINRMREHAIQLFEAKDYALHFNFEDALNATKIAMEQRKDFYLIYKEALNNTAKYADGKNVWISLTEKDSHITLLIKDDGKGFDVNSQAGSGNGLNNMQSRAKALKGVFLIVSEKGNGTTVSLTFEN